MLEVHICDQLDGLDRARRIEGDGLIVGFDELATVAPDEVHDVIIGIVLQAQAHTEARELGRFLQLLADLDELVPGLGGIDLGGLENVHARDQGPGTHGLWDAVGFALVHDGVEGDGKETARHLLHLLDDVGHLQEVSLGAIERHQGAPVPGDIRRVPRLQRRDQLRRHCGLPSSTYSSSFSLIPACLA